MATLSCVIVPAKKLKDGRHKIRIAVSHNGECRYIVTDIIVDNANQFRNGSVVRHPNASYLNTRLRTLLTRYQQAADSVEYSSCLKCAQLVELIKQGGHKEAVTLREAFGEFLSSRQIKESTRREYCNEFLAISRIISADTLVRHISQHSVCRMYSEYTKRKLSNGTISIRLRLLSSILLHCRRNGYVEPTFNPMSAVKIPQTPVRDAWLTVEQVRTLRDHKYLSMSRAAGRDLFMLSYYLGGINLADIRRMDFSGDLEHLKYIRMKTETREKINKYVEFEYPEEARELIRRIRLPDGSIGWRGKRLPNLSSISQIIASAGEEAGVGHLIYYAARKSFAQHAFNLGVDTSVIEYILGHKLGGNGSSLFHYIAVKPEMATEAVRKVLDNLKG